MEIERKYLLTRLPDMSSCRRKEIEQGYICEEGITLRVRRITEGERNTYILTYKQRVESDTDARVHIEEEYEIPEVAYQHLLSKADGNIIRKYRTLVPLAEAETGLTGLVAEVDEFLDRLEGIRIAEVEFPSIEAANGFVKPDWFGEDVSLDSAYTNSCMIWQ